MLCHCFVRGLKHPPPRSPGKGGFCGLTKDFINILITGNWCFMLIRLWGEKTYWQLILENILYFKRILVFRTNPKIATFQWHFAYFSLRFITHSSHVCFWFGGSRLFVEAVLYKLIDKLLNRLRSAFRLCHWLPDNGHTRPPLFCFSHHTFRSVFISFSSSLTSHQCSVRRHFLIYVHHKMWLTRCNYRVCIW